MGRRRQKPRNGPGANYKDIVRENKLFEQFYKEQGIVPADQWDDFIETLKTNLPATFRITGFGSHAKHMLKFLKGHYFTQLFNESMEGVPVERPTSIPWFPDELAWGFNITRQSIRKHPALEKLHKFLITETESGFISRQEAVSMIPPLLMDVQSHHKVLDMCAAPGSKTAQLIEMLHKDITEGWPEGFVIANDADNKRCYIMVHQAKRLNSPCSMIVNHDASFFPNLKMLDSDGRPKTVRYDRILCDVPCSGDGTMRKNYIIWKRWSSKSAFNLHCLQQRILLRGIELLEVKGRLVYSTCSFNPLENEAVIASVLKQCNGSVELVDVSSELPGLKRQPGMTTWKVITDKEESFPDYDAVPKEKKYWIKPSMFPLTAEEANSLNLTRCIRLLPHHQDTGGFFVAVLRKVSHLPGSKDAKQEEKRASAAMEVPTTDEEDKTSNEAAAQAANESKETTGDKPIEDTVTEAGDNEKPSSSTEGDTSAGPPRKKARYGGFKEDPFVFFKEDEELWPGIRDYYGVDDAFPVTQLLTRSYAGKKRNLYLVNVAVKQILQQNEHLLKVINSGVRTFSRSDAKGVDCDFRLAQDGILCIFPHMRDRRVALTKDDIVTLLTRENPFYNKFCDETRAQIGQYSMGSLIFVYDPKICEENPEDVPHIICGWKGKTSVRSFVAKGDRHHILRMCGVTDEAMYGDKLIPDEDSTSAFVLPSGSGGGGNQDDAVDAGDGIPEERENKDDDDKEGMECDSTADDATTKQTDDEEPSKTTTENPSDEVTMAESSDPKVASDSKDEAVSSTHHSSDTVPRTDGMLTDNVVSSAETK